MSYGPDIPEWLMWFCFIMFSVGLACTVCGVVYFLFECLVHLHWV